MEIEMKKSIMKTCVGTVGIQGLIDRTNELYPNFQLFSASKEWLNDDTINVIKFKGAKGDLLIKLI